MSAAPRTPHLGALLSTHRTFPYAPLGVFVLAAFFAILGAVTISGTTSDRITSAAAFTAVLGCLTWSGWLFSRAVLIYERGVSYVTLFKQRVWRWEDLDAIQFGANGGRRDYPAYTLIHNGRIALQVSVQFQNAQLAGDLMTQHSRTIFMERALQRIQRGETVAFHQTFAISQDGIRVRRKNIPWHAISEVVVRAWKLTIVEPGHEQRVVDLCGMRNPHVAIDLIALAMEAHAQPRTVFSLN